MKVEDTILICVGEQSMASTKLGERWVHGSIGSIGSLLSSAGGMIGVWDATPSMVDCCGSAGEGHSRRFHSWLFGCGLTLLGRAVGGRPAR